MFIEAYSPEQAAMGKMENGREVIILYIKEFKKECQAVTDYGLSKYTYNWFHNDEKDAYVLQVSWGESLNIAIRFNQDQYALLAALVEPKDVIITPVPITELVSQAKENGKDFLSFPEAIITFSQLVFDDPKQYLTPEDRPGYKLNN